MNHKLFLSTLTAAVAVQALIAPIQADAAVTFKDISKLDKASQEKIQTLVSKGIISGFTDGTFRPADNVTRGQYALFIAKALDLPAPQKPVSFKDVTKQVSTYDGIVRAYEAGIIKGYTKERFAPQETISRGQMAIMLDNALQYKASYPTKAVLKYTDKGSIGASSLGAVQRLTHYGIMGGHKSGKAFIPIAKGDRLMTVLSIHELMEVKGLLKSDVIAKPEDPVPETKPPGTLPYKPDTRDYTLAEMRQLLPATTRIERSGDGSVLVTDMVKEYYDMVQKTGYVGYNNQPKNAFENELMYLGVVHTKYVNAYPKYELISVNGVPYRYSSFFPEFLKSPQGAAENELNNMIATPPTENGEFLLDIGLMNHDIVTYTANDIRIEKATTRPVLLPSKVFVADVKAVFEDTNLVKVSPDGLTVSYQDKTLQMKNGDKQAMLNGVPVKLLSTVDIQQGTVIAPIQSVAYFLGLCTRKLDKYKNNAKVEIANYELPVFTLDEDGFIVSYEGVGWER